MERFIILIILIAVCIVQCQEEGESVLSAVLTPDKNLIRQERSYYERYGSGRPYDRLDDRPSRCGRCDDDDDDYDRGRDRDDDRRSNRPTYNNRYDRNKNGDDDDDRRYDNDRNNNNKNGTEDDNDDKKRPYDDKDKDKHNRRNKHRNRYDERDKYRPDYYDRFLRDPYRDGYDRDRYYDDPYPRRPSYDRYPHADRYDDYGGGYDRYSGYRRPYYEDRYNRGSGYDDAYGGYGPGVGRGPHESFRPWDETYRGQAGWDAGGRGYYFASGRPDAGSWGQRDYSRPVSSGGGWQGLGYSGYASGNGYSTGYPYRGSSGYAGGYADGYQDPNAYGQSSGWRSVGERRPYRDQSGVANLDKRNQQAQDNRYDQNQAGYGQIITYQPGSYTQSSTTPGNSYLFQREDEIVEKTETTVPPS